MHFYTWEGLSGSGYRVFVVEPESNSKLWGPLFQRDIRVPGSILGVPDKENVEVGVGCTDGITSRCVSNHAALASKRRRPCGIGDGTG